MNAEKTGKLIHDLRIEKGLTQQDLAEALNMSPTAISKWENGHSLPDISMLEPLSEILGISISEIVIGENKKDDKRMSEGAAAMIDTVTTDTALKSVIRESLIQRQRTVIKSVLSAAVLLSVLFAGCYYLFFHGLPAIQENISSTTAISYSDSGKNWTICFESNKGHHLLVTSEPGDDSADVLLRIFESPIGRSDENSFTWGYDGGKADPDFKVKVVYKDTEVIYSMKEEGLYGK